MLTLLAGENNFDLERAIDEITHSFDGIVERVDGSEIEVRQLPDLLMGVTLFADKRLIIIKHLSDNKVVWPIFSDWLPRLSDDVHVVLVESKPDKRTKTYKELQKVATIKDYKLWGERDTVTASQWVSTEAQRHGLALSLLLAKRIVERVGVDQWQLMQAIEKLAVLKTIDQDVIENVIDSNPTESVFGLFEAALCGDMATLRQLLATLKVTEDPYRVFGLLSGQGFQLAALVTGESARRTNAEIAKDVGAHPFVLSKLAPHAKRLGLTKTKKVIHILAEADAALKTSMGEAWLVVERALIKISQL